MIVRPPQPVPEPVPDSLDEQVDWMTYSHQEMYRMVHDGLDLAGATAVSADWARLGEALGEIGDELTRIVTAFADAWQGDAADQAVHAVSSLASWAGDAGGLATEVSGCITVEVDNAMRARNAMPAPHVTPPTLPRHDVLFAAAPRMIADQTAIVSQQRAAHRQAAETMEQFQTDSRDVYQVVPQFSEPKVGPKPPGGVDNLPAPEPQPTPPQQAPGELGPAARPDVVAGKAVPVAGPVAAPAPAPGPGAVAAPGQQPGAEPARPAAAAASAGGPAGARPGGGAPSGMPTGGMGGARKEEDLERKSPAYVKEDEDLWGLGDQVVAPQVIGEDQGRRA